MRLIFIAIFLLALSRLCYASPFIPDSDIHSYIYMETVGAKKIYYKLNQKTNDKGYDRYNVTIFEENKADSYQSSLYHIEFLDDKNSSTLMPYAISGYRCLAYGNHHFSYYLIQMEAPAPHTNEEDYIHSKVMHTILKDNSNIPVYNDTRKYIVTPTDDEKKYQLYEDTSGYQIFYIPKRITNGYMLFQMYYKPKGELHQLRAYIYDLYIAKMNTDQIWYSRRYINSYSSDVPLDNGFVGWMKLSKKKPDFEKIDYDKDIRNLIYFLISEYEHGHISFEDNRIITDPKSLALYEKVDSWRAGLP